AARPPAGRGNSAPRRRPPVLPPPPRGRETEKSRKEKRPPKEGRPAACLRTPHALPATQGNKPIAVVQVRPKRDVLGKRVRTRLRRRPGVLIKIADKPADLPVRQAGA